MGAFYSYIQEQLEDASYFYTFITGKNVIYSVSFDFSLYQDFLDKFPMLLKNGYGLGFYHTPTSNTRTGEDKKVSSTITMIIKDHFAACGDGSVLLYHCDAADNRQRCRHILFNRWYRNSEYTDALIKESIEVVIPAGDNIKDYYIGYITSKNNPDLDKIKEEFDAFSYNIVFRESNK